MKYRIMKILSTVIIISMSVAACNLIASNDDLKTVAMEHKVSIETDHAEYRIIIGSDLAITYTLRNDSDVPLFITNSSGYLQGEVQKKVGDQWALATAHAVPDVQKSPIELGPGETYTQDLKIPIPEGGRGVWKIDADEIEGTFRIRELIFVDWDPETATLGDLLPDEELVSNTFEIKR